MVTPCIEINGNKIMAHSPKAQAWNDLVAFQRDVDSDNADNIINEYAKIIAVLFGRDEVTADAILKNVNIDDIKPLYYATANWLIKLVNSKMEQIPNGEAAKGD